MGVPGQKDRRRLSSLQRGDIAAQRSGLHHSRRSQTRAEDLAANQPKNRCARRRRTDYSSQRVLHGSPGFTRFAMLREITPRGSSGQKRNGPPAVSSRSYLFFGSPALAVRSSRKTVSTSKDLLSASRLRSFSLLANTAVALKTFATART